MKIARLILSALALAAPAFAQQPKPEPLWQPFAAVFNADDPILLKGRIVRADWLEPKSVIWIEGVIKAGGTKQLWRVDTAAASLFTTQERASLAPDTVVLVRGYDATDTACAVTCRMAARDFTFPTGLKLLPKSGTGICTLLQLLQDMCPAAVRPGAPPTLQ